MIEDLALRNFGGWIEQGHRWQPPLLLMQPQLGDFGRVHQSAVTVHQSDRAPRESRIPAAFVDVNVARGLRHDLVARLRVGTHRDRI